MKKAALYAGIIAALICGTTFAAVISGVSAGAGSVYPTPVPAQYVAASYGSALANESIAAGADTALYCAMDNLDGTTSTPECGLNAIRHKGVGPFSDADYFSSPGVNDIFDLPATGWTVTVVWQRALGDSQILIGAEQLNTAGWYLRDRGTAGAIHFGFYPGGAASVTAATAVGAAGTVHVATAGLDAVGNVQLKVDGYATQTALATGYTPATATLTAIGKAASFGGYSTLGTIMEIHVASDPFVEATVTARQAAIMSCRNAGRCIPTSADEVAYFGGDQYTIGGSWCGDYPTCSAAKTFTRTGTVTTRARRYSWPALTPAQNGTVPRVATSGLHRQGYGARHAGMSGWSAGNYVSLGAGLAPDVLDFTGDFTECAIVEPTPVDFSGYASLISNTNATTQGYELFASADFTLRARYWLPGVADAVSSKVIPNSTIAVCWGRQGTTGKVQVGGGVVGTVATVGYLPASSAPALIGDNAARPAFAGKVHEIFATTTPASDAYLTYLTDAAMRCTTQGNCFPRDANTVMHCNGDEFTGSVLRCGVNTGADAWTTNGTVTLNAPDFYRNVNAQRISAPGAGPYSSANYFQWGTGPDVLDFTGSWTVCAVFDGFDLDADVVIDGGLVVGSGGWQMQRRINGSIQCIVDSAAGGPGQADTSTNAYAAGSLSLGCCGWDSSTDTIYAKLNASAVANGTKKFVANAAAASYIGRRTAAGAEHNGRVYEILALNKAPTIAQLDTIHRRWLNHQSLTGQALSNTHTADSTVYTSGGVVAGAAPQAVRIAPPTLYRTVPANAGDAGTTVTPLETPGGYITTPSASVKTQWPVVTTGWYTAGMTVTPNAGLAPDGTMTAMTVRETTANSSHMLFAVSNDLGVSGGYRTGSFFIRPYPLAWDGCLYIMHYLNRSDTGNDREYVGIDLRDLSRMRFGTAGSTITSSEGAGYEILKDGWLRVWFSVQAPTSTSWYPALEVRMHHPAGDCFSGSYTYVGDPNYGFDLWYWHELLGVGPQVMGRPASSGSSALSSDTIAASNPLRPNGTDWTNLLLQSEDLATTWATTSGGGAAAPTITANAALAPDGSFTADKIVFPASAGGSQYSIVYQDITATAAGYRPSIYLRTESGAGSVWLEWWNGATVYTKECALTTAWTRCEGAVQTLTAATWRVALGWDRISGIPAVNHPSITVYASSAQMETPTLAAGAQPYCPTTTAARTCGPGGATGKTITNLIPYNENLRGTGWSAGAVTVDAATNADGLHLLTPVGSGNYVQTSPGITTPSTAVVSASVKFQSDAATDVGTLCIYSGGFVSSSVCARESGAACATSSEDGGHSCCASGTFTTAADRISVHCVFGAATTSYFPFVSAGQYPSSNNTIYAGKMQLEPLAASGPYCGPTAAASRTCAPKQRWCVRAKDVTPGYGRRWNSLDASVWSMGSYGTANSASLRAYSTNTHLFFDIWDNAGNNSRFYWIHGFEAGSTHTIVSCNRDGVMSAEVDGVPVVGASTGTPGFQLQAYPPLVNIGGWGAGTGSWSGTVGAIEFNTTGDPKDFPSDRRTP